MPIPKHNPEQITEWIASGANDALRGHPPSADESDTAASKLLGWGSEGAKRFKGAKQALQRAEAKNNVKGAAPFRRLRRNQSAVNESLIDAVRGLLALVRDMAAELDSLDAQLADTRMQLAEQRVRQMEERADPAAGCE
ncbi:MAG: hypothetical protein ACR2ID_08025 [Chthoniobacterales bacterium]